MLIQFQEYLTFENIYLWTTLGILPFWLMLILIPNSKFTQFFINSVILPLILSALYVYVIYQSILTEVDIGELYKLYFSLDNLYTIFSTESFLLIFWLHFITLNLFLGSWISRDAFRNNMSRALAFIPLFFVFFFGPLGLILYWVIRVFYAKRLSFHD